MVGCAGDDVPEPEPEPEPELETEITFNVLSEYGVFDSRRVAFVAYQEGDGEWKSMPGQGGVYKARITSTRYGVAVGCSPRELLNGDTANDVVVHQTTVGETKNITESQCYVTEFAPTPPVTRTISVMPSGLAAGESGILFLRKNLVSVSDNNPRDATVVPASSLVLASIVRSVNGRGFLARVKRLPDVDLATATSLAVDFSQTVALVSWPLTLPAGAPVVSVTSSLRRGADFATIPMQGTTTEFQAFPASELREGDFIRIKATTDDGGMNGRESFFYMGSPGPANMALPAQWSLPAPTVPRTGKRLLSLELPDGTSAFPIVDLRIRASTSNSGLTVAHNAMLSGAWRGLGARTYVFPDLSAIPGYSATMSLQDGSEVTWSMSRDELNTREHVSGRIVHTTTQGGVIAN